MLDDVVPGSTGATIGRTALVAMQWWSPLNARFAVSKINFGIPVELFLLTFFH
jgi:hypothetical protein